MERASFVWWFLLILEMAGITVLNKSLCVEGFRIQLSGRDASSRLKLSCGSGSGRGQYHESAGNIKVLYNISCAACGDYQIAPHSCQAFRVLGVLNGILIEEALGQPKHLCCGEVYAWQNADVDQVCNAVSSNTGNFFTIFFIDLLGRELARLILGCEIDITSSVQLENLNTSDLLKPNPVTSFAVVTATSSNHFLSLLNLVESIRAVSLSENIQFIRMIVYDLGLTENQFQHISSIPGISVRRFNFGAFPEHFALRYITYAWKPAIIAECVSLHEHVLWLDSGCLLLGGLDSILDILLDHGFFTPRVDSAWTLGQLTHPQALRYLSAEHLADAAPLCSGAIGFSRGSRAHLEVLNPWLACAMERDCIAPAGSSRANHRQDLSAFSALVHLAGGLSPTEFGGLLLHQDVDFRPRIVHPANHSIALFHTAEPRATGLAPFHPAETVALQWVLECLGDEGGSGGSQVDHALPDACVGGIDTGQGGPDQDMNSTAKIARAMAGTKEDRAAGAGYIQQPIKTSCCGDVDARLRVNYSPVSFEDLTRHEVCSGRVHVVQAYCGGEEDTKESDESCFQVGENRLELSLWTRHPTKRMIGMDWITVTILPVEQGE